MVYFRENYRGSNSKVPNRTPCIVVIFQVIVFSLRYVVGVIIIGLCAKIQVCTMKIEKVTFIEAKAFFRLKIEKNPSFLGPCQKPTHRFRSFWYQNLENNGFYEMPLKNRDKVRCL